MTIQSLAFAVLKILFSVLSRHFLFYLSNHITGTHSRVEYYDYLHRSANRGTEGVKDLAVNIAVKQ